MSSKEESNDREKDEMEASASQSQDSGEASTPQIPIEAQATQGELSKEPAAPKPSHDADRRTVSFGDEVESREKEYSSTDERISDEEECNENVVEPSALFARQTSSAALAFFRHSFRHSDSLSNIHSEYRGPDRWKPWKSWSLPRFRATAVGCFSSMAVLTIRLSLDTKPTAYFIHSIVVFLDMVLIHLFTNSAWLSISGEIMTYICFLSFHATKETIFELMETTLIAILCSFHLIRSRNKYMDRNELLLHGMDDLRKSSLHLLRNSEDLQEDEIQRLEDDTLGHSTRTLPGDKGGWRNPYYYTERLQIAGNRFYTHFLDGSAGVMYTSFVGLIITELLTYGREKDH